MTLAKAGIAIVCAVAINTGGRRSPVENSRDLTGTLSREFPTGDLRPLQSPADGLFDDTVLHDVRLSINSRDLQVLQSRFQENINMPADIVVDGTRVRNVAVRVRGTASRNPTKLGLRVDFDHYTAGRRFRGLESIVLDNLYQDASNIREMLAMNLFRRQGVPAPREAFCRLTLNNRYYGLYGLVEEIVADFAARESGETDGYLYEYHSSFPYHGEDLGPGADLYKMLFEPRSHELEPDEQLYAPIRDLFHDLNEPDEALWLERVTPRLDLPQLMKSIGIEAALAEKDGIVGFFGMNNFYFYRSAVSGQHRTFIWDRDFAFSFLDLSVVRGLDEYAFLRRAFAIPELRAIYLDAAENTVRLIAGNNWLESEIDRLAALIDTSAREDTRKPFTNEFFDEQVEFMRQFARLRPAFVLDEMARVR
jgi:CotH protein